MNMKVDLCGVTLNNPVMTASGTFGSGAEYAEFVDLNKLGAVVTKGVANFVLSILYVFSGSKITMSAILPGWISPLSIPTIFAGL